MPPPSAGFLNVEEVCSSITIPTYYIEWYHNTGQNFLVFRLTVGYEIEPVGAGGGWYLGFLVWDNSFGV